MSERNELTERDRQLLEEIEEIVVNGGGERREADSLYGFCAHLASTVPQADNAFQQRLEARLVATLQQQQEVRTLGTMSQDKGEARSPSWFRRLAPGVGRINQIFEGGLTMKKGFALAALAALVIAVSTVALVPSVRAQFLRVVGISAPAGTGQLSDTPIPGGHLITVINEETGETQTMYMGEMHETTRQTVSWDEAQAAVDFSLRQPAYLPEGAELTRVELVSVPDGEGEIEERGVVLWYVAGDSELVLEQWPAFPEVLPPPPGVTTVTVNGAPGWAVSDEHSVLIWQTAEARYTLNGYLPLEEMLEIAESLE